MATIDTQNAPNKRVWIQLACVGQFKGHPAGPFELSPKVFSEIVANFKRDSLPVAIDAEHASEAECTSGSIPVHGAPAMGWIHEMDNRGDKGLWGEVEWLEPARSYIKEGRYRYLSPAVRFNARDRITGAQIGARLTSAAITNQPFLKSLAPLTASDRSVHAVQLRADGTARDVYIEEIERPTSMRLAYSPAEYMPRLRCILGLSELSTASECADQLARLEEHFDAAGEDPEGSHEGISLGRFVYPLRSLIGATLSATWDDVFAAVGALIEAAGGDVISDVDDLLDDPEHGVDTATGDGDPAQAFAPAGAAMNDSGGSTVATDSTTNGGASANAKDTAMADANEITMKLGAVTAERDASAVKLSATEAMLTDTKAKVADLSLSLKDEAAKRELAETELKTLRDEKTAREAKDIEERVSLAIEQHGDSAKITEADRDFLTLNLKSMPEKFETRYPRMKASEQHLLKNLTEKREGAAVVVGEGAAPTELDPRKAARALASQKGISLGEAQRILLRVAAPVTQARTASR